MPWRPPEVLSRRMATALLLAGYAVFFAPAFLHPGWVPFYRDHLVTNVPLRDFVRTELLAGRFPHWFPYEGLGVPVVGQIALGTFHPLNLLSLAWPAVYGEKFALLAGYLMGLVGGYRVGRTVGASRWAAVLGAWVFAFSGYTMGVSSIIAYALSMAAQPWVLWAAFRVVRRGRARDVAALAVAAALVFLAGDALGYVTSALWCALAFAERPALRAAGLMVAAGALSAALVAVELLPSMVVAADAVRAVGVPSPTLRLTWALHPLRLAEVAVPRFIPDMARALMLKQLMEGVTSVFCTTIFVPAVGLAGLAAAVHRRLPRVGWLALAVLPVAVLLAMGDHGPLLAPAQELLPGLTKFRYPERYLSLVAVAACLLLGPGFDRAVASLRSGAWAGLFFPLAVGLAVVQPGAAEALWWARGAPLDVNVAEVIGDAWATSGALTVVAVLGAALALTRHTTGSRFAVLGVVLLADLVRATAPHLPLLDAETFEPSPLAALVREEAAGAPTRVASLATHDWQLGVSLGGSDTWVTSTIFRARPSASGLSRLESLDSNLGALQRRHAMVFGASGQRNAQRAPLFNACTRVVGYDWPQLGVPLARYRGVFMRLDSTPCWPRAFLAGTVAVESPEAALRQLDALHLEDRVVPWEGGPSLATSRGTMSPVETPAPNRLRFAVDLPAPGAVVVAEDDLPGWHATVDGQEVPLHPTLVTALGLEVPAGHHLVDLQYRTPRLGLAAAVSAAGWLLVLALAWASRRAPAPTVSA